MTRGEPIHRLEIEWDASLNAELKNSPLGAQNSPLETFQSSSLRITSDIVLCLPSLLLLPT
ncbi:hypothetical protein J6590_095587 [Homalodisca vitripennis]|nr:hypothetical protein J6590_065604 [Homalodisca vitripennis]KAG8324297.1 hypothetical protein J6590_095587 [Homalodisca vitripennis]